MAGLIRFGVSLEKALLAKFDRLIKEKNYPTRSGAIRDLIRESLIQKEWLEGKGVAGAITLVYDHRKRELVNRLTNIQHDYHHIIISTQHIHLDHNNCLEIVVVKGKPKDAERLCHALKSTNGVKHGALTMATTGKEIP